MRWYLLACFMSLMMICIHEYVPFIYGHPCSSIINELFVHVRKSIFHNEWNSLIIVHFFIHNICSTIVLRRLVGFGSFNDLAPYKLLVFFTNYFILLLSFGKVYTTLVSPSSLFFFDKSRMQIECIWNAKTYMCTLMTYREGSAC
jgi:hypothetical protein